MSLVSTIRVVRQRPARRPALCTLAAAVLTAVGLMTAIFTAVPASAARLNAVSGQTAAAAARPALLAGTYKLGVNCAGVRSSGGWRGQICVSLIERVSPAGHIAVRGEVGYTVRSGGLGDVFATHVWVSVCSLKHTNCNAELQQYSLINAQLKGPKHYQLEESGWYPVNNQFIFPIWAIRIRAYGLTIGWYHRNQSAIYGTFQHPGTLDSKFINF
jgi:hypothetical protein